MKFTILTTSKPKHEFLALGEKEYLKRINGISKVELIEISIPNKVSKLPVHELIEEEAKLIEKHIKSDNVYISLDERGKEFTSLEFSKIIQQEFNSGCKGLGFIIGGPHGLSDLIKNKTKYSMALSRFTFTSQFARLIILEQIYRSLSIIKNLPYHKD